MLASAVRCLHKCMRCGHLCTKRRTKIAGQFEVSPTPTSRTDSGWRRWSQDLNLFPLLRLRVDVDVCLQHIQKAGIVAISNIVQIPQSALPNKLARTRTSKPSCAWWIKGLTQTGEESYGVSLYVDTSACRTSRIRYGNPKHRHLADIAGHPTLKVDFVSADGLRSRTSNSPRLVGLGISRKHRGANVQAEY